VTVDTLTTKGGSAAGDAPDGVTLENEPAATRTTHTNRNDRRQRPDVEEVRVIAPEYFGHFVASADTRGIKRLVTR